MFIEQESKICLIIKRLACVELAHAKHNKLQIVSTKGQIFAPQ